MRLPAGSIAQIMEPKEDEAAERCGFDDCDDGMFELYGSYVRWCFFHVPEGCPNRLGLESLSAIV